MHQAFGNSNQRLGDRVLKNSATRRWRAFCLVFRGLLDVLPAENSLAMVQAHKIAPVAH